MNKRNFLKTITKYGITLASGIALSGFMEQAVHAQETLTPGKQIFLGIAPHPLTKIIGTVGLTISGNDPKQIYQIEANCWQAIVATSMDLDDPRKAVYPQGTSIQLWEYVADQPMSSSSPFSQISGLAYRITKDTQDPQNAEWFGYDCTAVYDHEEQQTLLIVSLDNLL